MNKAICLYNLELWIQNRKPVILYTIIHILSQYLNVSNIKEIKNMCKKKVQNVADVYRYLTPIFQFHMKIISKEICRFSLKLVFEQKYNYPTVMIRTPKLKLYIDKVTKNTDYSYNIELINMEKLATRIYISLYVMHIIYGKK